MLPRKQEALDNKISKMTWTIYTSEPLLLSTLDHHNGHMNKVVIMVENEAIISYILY